MSSMLKLYNLRCSGKSYNSLFNILNEHLTFNLFNNLDVFTSTKNVNILNIMCGIVI